MSDLRVHDRVEWNSRADHWEPGTVAAVADTRVAVLLDDNGQTVVVDPQHLRRGSGVAPRPIWADMGAAHRVLAVAGDQPAVAAAMRLHHAVRIFDDCGHQPHDANPERSIPDGMVELEGIGLVCQAGYQFAICNECCTGPDGYQSELCASEHDPDGAKVHMRLTDGGVVATARGVCWPCPTVRAMAEALGVQP